MDLFDIKMKKIKLFLKTKKIKKILRYKLPSNIGRFIVFFAL